MPLNVPPVIVPGTVKLLICPVVELITPLVTVPDTVIFAAFMDPVTVKFDNEPTCVMFGCIGCVIVLLIVPAVINPDTVKPVNVPRLVMFGWPATVTGFPDR